MTNATPIRIRPETKSDVAVIEEVTSTAFQNADHSNHNEQFIVRDLREANQLSISLVAEDEITEEIVGHIAVSPVGISDGSENWYGIGPISVLPQYQGKGIGSSLIKRVLADLQSRQAAGCVVLGNPKYYTRFGFKVNQPLQLPGAPPEHFMALTWHEPTPVGTVSFDKAFEASEPSSLSYDVLVTGSAGHLGTALMLSLPSLGFNPLGIDILPSPTTTLEGSVYDRAFIASIFAKNHIKHVLHAATLHKPHVCSHSKEQFVLTNVIGTLTLLEESARFKKQIESFIFFSTTSTFGMALSPKPGHPAAWIDESVVPVPKNIYGVTKVAAEDMCRLIQMQSQMPVLVLRTSRFFPEEDDDEDRRASMSDENLKVLELAYRRCDIEDIVSAAVCSMRKAKDIRWGKYIISAPPPFNNDSKTLDTLNRNPAEVIAGIFPEVDAVFKKNGWKHLSRMDRVYDSSRAVKELGWDPKYTFGKTLERLAHGENWRSDLTSRVGKKGYHAVSTGVYTKR
ncbi:uncharacterized protein LDX57_002572 [Aspergillus melleus]|uniref:uncharacterized protein n=1 Tax=Aspergillus melleus TaxID=138277 RepID=UPI001E8D388D|nr:uncharacterized protein LDX57_002572 [Aspergillus melleus]KAH8424829.1 hypothetical protein LDX57_002572 [Aspergillus melleus]